jgi:predicted DNA-binding protein YlxM (UPF0122 family)
MNEKYKVYLTELARQAEAAFHNYYNLPKEQRLVYEKKINYERDRIVISAKRYEIDAYIYLLFDPTAISKTCYIGVSNDAEYRLERHINNWDGGTSKNKKKCWLKSMKNRGVDPIYLLIDIMPVVSYWQIYESFYIAYFKYIGINLCNGTLGGDGNPGYKHIDEDIEKMRQLKLGIPKTEEWKQKIMRQDLLEDVEYIKELYLDQYSLNEIADEYKTSHSTITLHLQKAGIEIREEKHTERYIEKLRKAQTGKTHTEETKQKIGEARIGIPRSEETRTKISTTRIEKIAIGEITMPTNRASGKDAGRYRDDVNDELLLKLHNDGLSLREIGRQTNLEHHSVKDRLTKVGVKFEISSKKDTTKFVFNLAKALELHNSGLSCNAIGKELGCDSKVVKKHLQKAGIVFEQSSYSRKSLDGNMERIKELYSRGFNYAEIGRMFDTSGVTIKTYLQKHNIVE